MQPRGPLMIEHRLIEKMIGLIKEHIKMIEQENTVDPRFIEAAVDFIRTYADRTHHGKEEDILFDKLSRKDLKAEDQKLMDELIQEHVFGRKVTGELVEANEQYKAGNDGALDTIGNSLRTLVEFYPQHIAKEDEDFFPASQAYLSQEEQESMLDAFWEFDKKMIHEKYESLVEEWKTKQEE